MYLVGDGRHNIENETVWRSVAVNISPRLFQILCKFGDKIATVTNTPSDPTLISLHNTQEIYTISLFSYN